MPSIRPRSFDRSGSLRLRLAVFTTLAALAAGCEQPSVVPLPGDAGGGGAGADSGSSSEQGGGGATSTSTSTQTTTSSTTSSTQTTTSTTETTQAATFVVSLDTASPTVDLAAKVQVTVAIDPKGYTGPVALAVDNLNNDGVTAKLDTPTVTLDGATMATVKLTLTTVSSTPPGKFPFTVSGTVEGGTKGTSATLSVLSAITIVIPQGVNGMAGTEANPYKLAFGDYPTIITAPAGISDATPVTVRFYNDDDVVHAVHAGDNEAGFPHDPKNIQPNSMNDLVRKVNSKGTYSYYLHDQDKALTVGRIVIQ